MDIIETFRVRKILLILDPFDTYSLRKFPYLNNNYSDFDVSLSIWFYRWKRENRCKFFSCTSYRLTKIGIQKSMMSYQMSCHYQMIESLVVLSGIHLKSSLFSFKKLLGWLLLCLSVSVFAHLQVFPLVWSAGLTKANFWTVYAVLFGQLHFFILLLNSLIFSVFYSLWSCTVLKVAYSH